MNFKQGCLLSIVVFGFVQGLIMCVIGILVDSQKLFFEIHIANKDLAAKTLLKSALIHIVIFTGAAIIYHVKYRETQQKKIHKEGEQIYERVGQNQHY